MLRVADSSVPEASKRRPGETPPGADSLCHSLRPPGGGARARPVGPRPWPYLKRRTCQSARSVREVQLESEEGGTFHRCPPLSPVLDRAQSVDRGAAPMLPLGCGQPGLTVLRRAAGRGARLDKGTASRFILRTSPGSSRRRAPARGARLSRCSYQITPSPASASTPHLQPRSSAPGASSSILRRKAAPGGVDREPPSL